MSATVGPGYDAHRPAHRFAATRGLLLDLLVTGDREAVDAASDLLTEVFVRVESST